MSQIQNHLTELVRTLPEPPRVNVNWACGVLVVLELSLVLMVLELSVVLMVINLAVVLMVLELSVVLMVSTHLTQKLHLKHH